MTGSTEETGISQSVEPPALTDVRAFLEALKPVLSVLIEPDALIRFEAMMLDMVSMAKAPQTFARDAERVFRAGVRQVDRDRLAALLEAPAFAEQMLATFPLFRFLSSPPAQATLRLLDQSPLPLDRMRELAADARAIDLTTMIPVGMDSMLQSEAPAFEFSARTMASALAGWVEGLYQPLLRSTYSIWGAANGVSKPPPEKLGALIAECAREWQASDLSSLCDDRLRIVRHSEAHRRTSIDIERETICFRNRRPDGTVHELSMSGAEFQAFAMDALTLILGIWTPYYIRFR